MILMKLYLNSRNGTHSATAEYNENSVTVLAGSIVNMELLYPKMPPLVKEKRDDRSIVSADGKLLVDVTFDTPTSAAQFVTGRSVNGYIVWRPDNNMSLKQYLEKNKE